MPDLIAIQDRQDPRRQPRALQALDLFDPARQNGPAGGSDGSRHFPPERSFKLRHRRRAEG